MLWKSAAILGFLLLNSLLLDSFWYKVIWQHSESSGKGKENAFVEYSQNASHLQPPAKIKKNWHMWSKAQNETPPHQSEGRYTISPAPKVSLAVIVASATVVQTTALRQMDHLQLLSTALWSIYFSMFLKSCCMFLTASHVVLIESGWGSCSVLWNAFRGWWSDLVFIPHLPITPLSSINVTFLVRGTSIGTGITSARRQP